MSKTIKTVARIALPIAAGFVLGPAGFGLTSTAIGGALGGAAAGALGGGGLKGAALGAATGYLTAPGVVGTAAHTVAEGVAGPVSYGSGLAGLATGGGVKALTGGIVSAATDPSKLLNTAGTAALTGLGNQAIATDTSKTALKAANIQSAAIDRGIAANTAAQAPYTALGKSAADQIQTIQADPAGYIKNNPLYTSLADDAQRRLLANQAAKGKVGSGGTASALQEQLLNLGNGLVTQQVGQLQDQVNTGAGAASNVGNTTQNALESQGGVQAAGKVASNKAISNGYQNQINTILALQGLNKAPIYAPNLNL